MEIEENSDYARNYSDNSFWSKVLNIAKKAGIKIIYLALLLYYALNSNNLSLRDRATIYFALGYLILPVDLIPDSIPIIGLTDDFGVLIKAFERIKENITDDIRKQAKDKLIEIFKNIDESEIAEF